MKNKTIFQYISLLLQYPEENWVTSSILSEITHHLEKNLAQKLQPFFDYLREHSIDELQDTYVRTFDFNEKTNLYLTYSKVKEDRERGQLLLELKETYEKEGLQLDSTELPDYLPVFFEFIAVCKRETAETLLKKYQPMIDSLKKELVQLNSPYAIVVEASLIVLNQIVKGGTCE